MAINREKKVEILENVREILKKSKAVTFVNFKGLKVTDITNIRKELREKGVSYLVAKKTLVKKALEESKFEGEIPSLDGELALVYSDDELSSSREIFVFQKKFKDNLKILGSVFNGVLKNGAETTQIATIPSMDVLRGQLVGMLISPIRSFVFVLDQISKTKQS